ncbi:MAG: ketoacyl-ACP synthase III [Elusimicrobiales bacterium]
MFKIIGTGMYLPEKLVTNEDLFAKFGRDPLEKIMSRIGHGARYYCAPNQCSADLAYEAAKKALEDAKVDPKEIDLQIISTDTPSQLSPATGSEVQYRLGTANAGVFDVNCACAGFVTALDIAAHYLDGKQYKKALVIGTYAMSKFLDPDDGMATPLFGDGAGAMVLSYDAANKTASILKADGQYWDYMGIYGGGSREPFSQQVLDSKKHTVKIPKKFPATLNKEHWPPLLRETLAKMGLKPGDVNMYIFTQIRKVTVNEVMEEFKLPMDRTHTIMEKWGYTGSACVPMALHDAIKQGKVKRGDRVALCASGGGYSMASMVFTY